MGDWMNGWVHGWMDGWMGGWMVGWRSLQDLPSGNEGFISDRRPMTDLSNPVNGPSGGNRLKKKK